MGDDDRKEPPNGFDPIWSEQSRKLPLSLLEDYGVLIRSLCAIFYWAGRSDALSEIAGELESVK